MAFTQADLVALDAAIVALAKGERVTEVRMSDRTLRTAECTLTELLKLRDQIVPEATATAISKRPRLYRSTHAKGL